MHGTDLGHSLLFHYINETKNDHDLINPMLVTPASVTLDNWNQFAHAMQVMCIGQSFQNLSVLCHDKSSPIPG